MWTILFQTLMYDPDFDRWMDLLIAPCIIKVKPHLPLSIPSPLSPPSQHISFTYKDCSLDLVSEITV
jgi:hypothetical protein